jgi:hypothetical protein
MVIRSVDTSRVAVEEGERRVRAAIESTPGDAVVQLRIDGPLPAALGAASLRAMAGARTVTLGSAASRFTVTENRRSDV